MSAASLALEASAVLFDLDGTLADSAADLAFVLNQQLVARRRPLLPVDALRPYVSQGARGLLRAGFGIGPGDAEYAPLRDEFLELYERNLYRETRLFPGMSEVLDTLDARGIAWGIVTNKLERFALPLVKALGLHARAACVIGGDTTSRAKPHPEPLMEASRRVGVAAQACLYVGDDERDVQAGLAAGMTPVVALYGYLGDEKPPEQWGAELYIARPLELLHLLGAAPSMR